MWPENWAPVALFCQVGTQWMVGMGGPTGLRYEAIYPLIDRASSSPTEWNEIFSEIQILESAALAQMNKQ